MPERTEEFATVAEMEMAVLCAIAYHHPIDRAGLADIFGKEISRDLLARLRYKDDSHRAAIAAAWRTAYVRDDRGISGDV